MSATLAKEFRQLDIGSIKQPASASRGLLPRSPNAVNDGDASQSRCSPPQRDATGDQGCLKSAPVILNKAGGGRNDAEFAVTSRDLKHAQTDHRPVALSPKEYFEMARLRQNALASKFGGSLQVKGIRKLDDTPKSIVLESGDKIHGEDQKLNVENPQNKSNSLNGKIGEEKEINLHHQMPEQTDDVEDLITKIKDVSFNVDKTKGRGHQNEKHDKERSHIEGKNCEEKEKPGELIGRGPIQASKGKIYATQGPYPCQPFSHGGYPNPNVPDTGYGAGNQNGFAPSEAMATSQHQAQVPQNFQSLTPMDFMRKQRQRQQRHLIGMGLGDNNMQQNDLRFIQPQQLQLQQLHQPPPQIQPQQVIANQRIKVEAPLILPAGLHNGTRKCELSLDMDNNSGYVMMYPTNPGYYHTAAAVGEYNKPMEATSMCNAAENHHAYTGQINSSSPRAAPSPPDIYSPSGFSVDFNNKDSPEPIQVPEVPQVNAFDLGFYEGQNEQNQQIGVVNGIMDNIHDNEIREKGDGGLDSPRTVQNKQQLGELNEMVQSMNELPDDLSDFILSYSKPYQAGGDHDNLNLLGELLEDPTTYKESPSSSSGISSMGSPSNSMGSSMDQNNASRQDSRKNSCDEGLSSPIGSDSSDSNHSPPSVVSDTPDLKGSIDGSPNQQRAAVSHNIPINQSPSTIPFKLPIRNSRSTGSQQSDKLELRKGRERLRALIGTRDREQGWVWAAKCWHSAPQALCFLRDADGDTFLHKVVYHKDLAKIYGLVEHIIKYENPMYPNCFDLPNNNNETPLFVAVQRRLDEVVEYLLECGANANIRTRSNGEAPLHYAAARGMSEVVQSLIQFADTDLNLYDSSGLTPLLSSVKYHGVIEEDSQCLVNNKPIITALLKAGANCSLSVKGPGGKTILHYAVEAVDVHLLEIFRENLSSDDLFLLATTRSEEGERPLDTLCRIAKGYDVINGASQATLDEQSRSKLYSMLMEFSGNN